MSLYMCTQLVLGEADCAQEYAALFLGFAGTECLRAANCRATDKMCRRWLLIIWGVFWWIFFFFPSTASVLVP